jgi:tetratricopeptide (TPR) repeat protein
VATSLNGLAALYGDQSQYAKAEPLYGRALAIWEKALGPEHPEVAASLNGLATLYGDQGQYAKAEPLYIRALVQCIIDLVIAYLLSLMGVNKTVEIGAA